MDKLLGLPVVTSKHGHDVDNMIVLVHYLMIALFAGWAVYFAYVLFRFRKGANPKADYHGAKSHASSYIEGAVAIVEAFLLIGFAIPLWAKVVDDLPGPEQQPTIVRVVAQQFAWTFLYPGKDGEFRRQEMRMVTKENDLGMDASDPKGKDDIRSENDLTVPVNRPVVAYISSKDVIHSFKIIAMRVTQDAIPGMRIPTQFIPTQVGKYQINCAQLCGVGHANMVQGYLNVLSQADYDAWTVKKAGSGATAPAAFE
ncbi:MAG: cytochrome c oxidase subunit II [Verrucomicrobia bacterium]|nr:cytochrome c oxidase subunit II [Verrucomicrobiota bacterium]MBI3870670.1 cytochrome c oxidase subunit II [Verrucomicrobiota bacterium]